MTSRAEVKVWTQSHERWARVSSPADLSAVEINESVSVAQTWFSSEFPLSLLPRRSSSEVPVRIQCGSCSPSSSSSSSCLHHAQILNPLQPGCDSTAGKSSALLSCSEGWRSCPTLPLICNPLPRNLCSGACPGVPPPTRADSQLWRCVSCLHVTENKSHVKIIKLLYQRSVTTTGSWAGLTLCVCVCVCVCVASGDAKRVQMCVCVCLSECVAALVKLFSRRED